MGDELSPAWGWVWRQLSSCALEGLSLHLGSECLATSVAGNHNFKMLIVVRLIHPCSTSTGKLFHVDSKSVVWVALVDVYVPLL